MSALEDYLKSTKDGMGFMPDFTPVAMPFQQTEVGGFSWDVQPGPLQLPAPVFAGTSVKNVWSTIGANVPSFSSAIGQVVDMVAAGSGVAQSIGNVMGGVMEGIGAMAPYAAAANNWAQWIVGYIEGTLVENDERRYECRLNCVDLLHEAGPNTWAGNNWFNARYSRKRPGKSSVSNMCWGPDPRTMSQNNPRIPRSGDCGEGGSNNSPKGSSCKGSFSLYPVFMPLFDSRRSYGNPGAAVVMRRGMERAPNSGSLVYTKMAMMQADLLMDPALNMLCDYRFLYSTLYGFLLRRWTPAFKRFTEPSDVEEQYMLQIDPEYDPENVGHGYYFTPSGLIGAYMENFEGSLAAPAPDPQDPLSKPPLDRVVYTAQDTMASSFGGNGLRLSDYNTVVSSVAQFANTRIATLRRRSFCVEMVETGFVDKIPEPLVRAAVHSSAAGDPPPPLLAAATYRPGGPSGLQVLPVKAKRKKSGSGMALAAGGVLALMAMKK